MNRIVLAIAIVLAGAAIAPPAQAQTPTFTFSLSPAADLFGAPGQLVGWGYSITNNDSIDWLTIDTVSPTSNFLYSTPDSLNFISLMVGPGDTQFSDFSPFTSGLFEVTVNPDAPPGSFDAGTFEVSATWYTQEPGVEGCEDFSCIDTFFPVQNSDQAQFSVTATPEPATWPLLLIGIGLCAAGSRRRRRG